MWEGATLLLVSSLAAGCGALASSPSWAGGGMAVTAGEREAAEDARETAALERIASQPTEIGAKHILVMHAKSANRPPGVSRSPEEARKRAGECLLKIRGGAQFDAVLKECTDEPGGVERLGDLGVFDRQQMVKEFADVAFGLKVGEVSEPVETQFGFHIIKRTE